MSQSPSIDFGIGYQGFSGRNIDQMPRLIAGGLVPLSAFEIMQRRFEVLDSYKKVLDNPDDFSPKQRKSITALYKAWWENCIDTGDAIFYHPNGKVKFVLDAQNFWRGINLQSELLWGGLVLPDGTYEITPGLELANEDFAKFLGMAQTKTDIIDNIVWRFLAREEPFSDMQADTATINDRVLGYLRREKTFQTVVLSRYSDHVFSNTKKDKNMGIMVGYPTGDFFTGKLLSLARIEYLSKVEGLVYLEYENGLLVAKSPDPTINGARTLEKRILAA